MHEQGFVHCDLKPDNIMFRDPLSGDLSHAELVLIDFGLARNYKSLQDGTHNQQTTTKEFNGNVELSS